MDKINWAKYNSDDFEMFCSALLTFEFGKSYQPFSAQGRDGGIDGKFFGDYGDLSGDWRFQFKFFKTPRSESVGNLRFQIKKEAGKLEKEDFFVLLTNVELLPQEHKALIELFETEINEVNKKCTCLVWDGTKIFNSFLHYPILLLWLNEGFKTAQLQGYQVAFDKNLKASDFDPASFTNFFISRETNIAQLNDFIFSKEKILLIRGEAGIGKTRLVIEFFKQKIDSLANWIPLVLINRNIDFDKIRKALSSESNYIILIDDAHNYKPEIISDMKALAESLQNNVKLILTARTLDAFNSFALIKEYETIKIPQIKLNDLTRPDTEKVFRHYLDNTNYKHYTNELISTSFGKPILIVAMLNAIFNNTPISGIKEHDFLKNYVINYFNTYVEKVCQNTGTSKLKVRLLLQNIALIEPFNFIDDAVINKLSEIHSIETSIIQEALKLLVENGFVNGRNEQSIKPDYYSDILLSEIDKTKVVSYITEFAPFLNKIIINLSSVDEINNKSNLLKEILLIYIKQIESGTSILTINQVLTTIVYISYLQPDIAKSAVEIFIKCLALEDHAIARDYRENQKFSYQPGVTPINNLISILSNLYNSQVNSNFVWKSTLKVCKLVEEKNLINVFSFSKRDVVENFGMVRQSYIVNEFSINVEKYKERELHFTLLCIRSFLSLEFTITEWQITNRENISILTYYLPASASVKRLRKSLVELLIILYKLPNALTLKSEILKQIIDIPRGIFATQRNSSSYKNDKEISIVLNFLKQESGDFDILDQKEILEKLFWYQKWGISTNLIPLIDEIKQRLKPKNLTEKLSQLFSKAEINSLEALDIDQFVTSKFVEIIQVTNEIELANAIVSFLKLQQNPPHYYWQFQNRLEDEFPEYAKVLHEKMFKTSFEIYGMYGWRILDKLYFKHHDDQFYWCQVEELEKLDNIEADNVLLAVYSNQLPDTVSLTEKDIEVIVKIFNKKRNENNYGLATGLQSLFSAKYSEVMSFVKDFLTRAEQRNAEMFFTRLRGNKTVNIDQMADLILNNSVRFQLTYEFERCLNLVLPSSGSDSVFSYLLRRFEYKKNILITKKTLGEYEFVPDGQYSHLFDKCDPLVRTQMFIKALEWYFSVDGEGGHLYYGKDLLDYLKPSQSIETKLVDYYDARINELALEGKKLIRVLDSLSIFQVKDDNLMQIVINAFRVIYEFEDSDPELYNKLKSECHMAIVSVGVKSGPANMPFQIDLDIKELLISQINNLPEFMPVSMFLQEVLEYVDQDINRSTDNGNFSW